MHSSGDGIEAQERIPQLTTGWEERGDALSPAEGFLLSRIDGRTPWSMLRQIGGLAPEEVDTTLERWVKEGLILLGQDGSAATLSVSATGSARVSTDAHSDEPKTAKQGIDANLELETELQERILDFEARIETASYFEVLGVDRSGDARDIKRAYFKLSKEFHPDRYFRRNIGDYGARLDRIFKKVVEAYELLSDPTTRSEIESTLGSAPSAVGLEEGSYRGAETGRTESLGREKKPSGYRTPTRMENLERLRRRFKVPKKVLAERQFKAGQFYQAAQVAAYQDNWLEAAASARLAIAFDPWSRKFKEGFADIQSQVHRVRADELLAQAEDAGSQEDALKLLEEALHYRPMDPAANARAARLALDVNDVDRALEYAENACELEPQSASYHVVHSRALRRAGRAAPAASALAKAADLEPKNLDVLSEQQLVRRSRKR